MKKQPKVPTSEAALRRLTQKYGDGVMQIEQEIGTGKIAYFLYTPSEFESYGEQSDWLILWRGRLSDIYRKRKPLKGVAKKLRKAIR